MDRNVDLQEKRHFLRRRLAKIATNSSQHYNFNASDAVG
jgi:hypothetical protein